MKRKRGRMYGEAREEGVVGEEGWGQYWVVLLSFKRARQPSYSIPWSRSHNTQQYGRHHTRPVHSLSLTTGALLSLPYRIHKGRSNEPRQGYWLSRLRYLFLDSSSIRSVQILSHRNIMWISPESKNKSQTCPCLPLSPPSFIPSPFITLQFLFLSQTYSCLFLSPLSFIPSPFIIIQLLFFISFVWSRNISCVQLGPIEENP